MKEGLKEDRMKILQKLQSEDEEEKERQKKKERNKRAKKRESRNIMLNPEMVIISNGITSASQAKQQQKSPVLEITLKHLRNASGHAPSQAGTKCQNLSVKKKTKTKIKKREKEKK